MIEAQVWLRVTQVVGETGRPGSGLFIEHGGEDFLVTAKHLCTDESEEQITVKFPGLNDGAPESMMLERIGDISASPDVAVFRLPRPIARKDLSLPLGSDGVAFGQDVFILGYPYGLSFTAHSWGDIGFPIAKKGIVSAGRYEQDGTKGFYIDAMANPGFSGGPAVYREGGNGKFKVLGIVKGHLMAPLEEAGVGDPAAVKVPAGLSFVVDFDHVQELLNGTR